MLADFIKTLVGLIDARNEVKVTRIQGLYRQAIVSQGGSRETIELDAPLRNATLFSQADLIRYLTDTQIAAAPEVYVHGGGVVAMLDRDDRLEVARVTFKESAISAELKRLAQTPKSMSVKDTVRFMRNALNLGPAVIAPFRKIDFTRTSSGRTDIDRQKESLGRSVESAVQGVGDLPETVMVKGLAFLTRGFDYAINVPVRIDVDHDEQELVLSVDPDLLTETLNEVGETIAEDLRHKLGEQIPVFMGGFAPM